MNILCNVCDSKLEIQKDGAKVTFKCPGCGRVDEKFLKPKPKVKTDVELED